MVQSLFYVAAIALLALAGDEGPQLFGAQTLDLLLALVAVQQLEVRLANHVDCFDPVVFVKELDDLVYFLLARDHKRERYLFHLGILDFDLLQHGRETLEIMAHVKYYLLSAVGNPLEATWLLNVEDMLQDLRIE